MPKKTKNSDGETTLSVQKVSKNKSTKTYKRSNRNARRQIRRKRSKIRYYKSLKKVRFNQFNEDLCSAVEVFDISDMDWAPTHCSSNLPLEVIEWQNQDQIAYWKSRALSLELENRMLRQHLRNVYAKTVEDGSLNNQTYQPVVPEDTMNNRPCKPEKTRVEVVPNIPENKNRLEEMQGIYGERAQKLMGMETAIQLDYERHLEQSKPIVWPSLPLNLKFE